MSEEPKSLLRRTKIFLGERQTSVLNRLVARGVDLLILIAVYFLGKAMWPPLGFVGALVLCAVQDCLGVGQSIGKRMLGLKVVDDTTGLPCSIKNSAIRNLLFLFAIVCIEVPLLWVLLFFVCAPILALEIYLIISLESGIRLGDVMGNTLVTDYFEEEIPAFQ